MLKSLERLIARLPAPPSELVLSGEQDWSLWRAVTEEKAGLESCNEWDTRGSSARLGFMTVGRRFGSVAISLSYRTERLVNGRRDHGGAVAGLS